MDKENAFKLINTYLTFLKDKDYAIITAYMFGSYVRGSQDEDSDIDLAIVLKNVKNTFDTQVELMKLIRHVDTRIEPHPFAEADFDMSNPFAREIMQTGIRVL